MTASEAIEELLSAQIVLRNNRRLQTAMRSSRPPTVKTHSAVRLQLAAEHQGPGSRSTASTSWAS